jgi:uncharacterized membrane protein
MKNFILVLIGLAILGLPLMTLAQTPDLFEIAKDLSDALFRILLALALVFIFYSAFTFITAGGESAKIEAAKSGLTYALIGIMIAFLAKAIGALFH